VSSKKVGRKTLYTCIPCNINFYGSHKVRVHQVTVHPDIPDNERLYINIAPRTLHDEILYIQDANNRLVSQRRKSRAAEKEQLELDSLNPSHPGKRSSNRFEEYDEEDEDAKQDGLNQTNEQLKNEVEALKTSIIELQSAVVKGESKAADELAKKDQTIQYYISKSVNSVNDLRILQMKYDDAYKAHRSEVAQMERETSHIAKSYANEFGVLSRENSKLVSKIGDLQNPMPNTQLLRYESLLEQVREVSKAIVCEDVDEDRAAIDLIRHIAKRLDLLDNPDRPFAAGEKEPRYTSLWFAANKKILDYDEAAARYRSYSADASHLQLASLISSDDDKDVHSKGTASMMRRYNR